MSQTEVNYIVVSTASVMKTVPSEYTISITLSVYPTVHSYLGGTILGKHTVSTYITKSFKTMFTLYN